MYVTLLYIVVTKENTKYRIVYACRMLACEGNQRKMRNLSLSVIKKKERIWLEYVVYLPGRERKRENPKEEISFAFCFLLRELVPYKQIKQ